MSITKCLHIYVSCTMENYYCIFFLIIRHYALLNNIFLIQVLYSLIKCAIPANNFILQVYKIFNKN